MIHQLIMQPSLLLDLVACCAVYRLLDAVVKTVRAIKSQVTGTCAHVVVYANEGTITSHDLSTGT